MTQLIVEYDSTGAITEWRYESEAGYGPADGELVVDDADTDHRDLDHKRVDLSGREPALVDDPDYRPSEPLDRAKMSAKSRQRYTDARATSRRARTAAEEQGTVVEENQISRGLLSGNDAKLQTQINAQEARLDALQEQLDAVQQMCDNIFEVLSGDSPADADDTAERSR